MRHLRADEIIRINVTLVGDPEPAFDFGELESAVYRPSEGSSLGSGFSMYPSIHDAAAAMFDSLVRHPPFGEKNDATAALAVIALYGLNGVSFEVDEGELVGLVGSMRAGEIPNASIAVIFGKWSASS